MIVSTVAVFSHFVITHPVRNLFGLNLKVYLYSGLMAVFSTVIPTFLMAEGIKRLGSGPASIVSSVGPISTIVLAALFLGEPIYALQVLGTVIVLVSVIVVGLTK
jgi:drug/metabolite transporter (DMT)-like permease